MYSAQPNGAEGATINPAALNSADLNRGIKRSRSPDSYRDPLHTGPADDDKPRKRGRPMKGRSSGSLDESPGQAPLQTPVPVPQAMPPQTPQSATMPLPLQSPQQYAPPPATPSQASPPPPKPTPKSTLKALPTVRDHTTDQLAPGGDEYLPRETDEAGEKKVMPNGGREYRCRTFLVQNRGEKLFMLATECARVLGYRDSYLLFNKNRSLYKIIANQVEKDDLVNQEVLPFSYRSRQIAIVTARSMFRQFGSRVISHGRRVRDDYWEAKARKQGFTENDLAGEKRPGAAKAREAAMEASQNASILGAPHGEIVYSNTPGQFGAPQAPLVQPDYNDTRTRDYSNILKAPRQEITGPAYQDRTQPAPIPELHAQAHHAAEFNRGINHQREMRGDYLQGMWRRPHEQPVQSQPNLAQPIGATADSSAPSGTPAGGRAGQHPGQQHSSAPAGGLQQAPSQPPAPGVVSGQSPQLMMTAPPYSQPSTSQTQMQPTRLGSSSSLQQQGAQTYSYPQSNQMWQQTPQTPQYSYSHPSQAHQSPHHQQPQQPSQQQSQQQQQQQQQQQPSSQQSSQQQPPQPNLRQQPGAPGGQVQQGSMPYSGIPGMTQGYTTAASGHGISYDQTPRQYMHQSPAPAPAVTQPWSGQAQSSQWWPNQPQ